MSDLVHKRPELNVLRIDPTLTIDVQDIADFITAFEAVLSGQSVGGKDSIT